jgi:hypothetical protein
MDRALFWQKWLGAALLAAGIGLSSTFAWAGDYCISFPTASNPYTQVGRGFSIPANGKCRGWTGFTPQLGFNSPSYGTGCTSSDGTNFTLNLTTQIAGILLFDSIDLSLPPDKGQTTGTAAESQPAQVTLDGVTYPPFTPYPVSVTGAACNGVSIPSDNSDSSTDSATRNELRLRAIGAAPATVP